MKIQVVVLEIGEMSNIYSKHQWGYLKTLWFEKRKNELGNEYDAAIQYYRSVNGRYSILDDEPQPFCSNPYPPKDVEKFMLKELSKDDIAREHIYSLLKGQNDDRVKMFLPRKQTEKGKINDEMIQKAKDYPIDSMVDIDRMGKALCIFHSDTQPSMKYYEKTNTVYCFACNKGGDSISVYRELNNCDFKTAVIELN